MTTCCQGTVSPVGKVCGDCPHRPYKPPESLDILEPKDVAKRARELNLHGDEPWPGYSDGKAVTVPPNPSPPPHDEDETDIWVSHLIPMFFQAFAGAVGGLGCGQIVTNPDGSPRAVHVGGGVLMNEGVFRLGETKGESVFPVRSDLTERRWGWGHQEEQDADS